MSTNPTTSQIVAGFAAGFDATRISPAILRQCGRALADTLAVAIAGLREPGASRMRAYVEACGPCPNQGSAPSGFARLWGSDRAAPVEAAALFNATVAHLLDFDDASSAMSGHPSVALLPALVALAEARDIDGTRLASAYVVPNWYPPEHAGKTIDFKNHASAAFAVLPGGYAQRFDAHRRWVQVTGHMAANTQRSRAPQGTRRKRRTRLFEGLRCSEVKRG
jgi:MmgE/PrpD N-terminal domain